MSTGVASTIKRKGGTIVEEEAARQGPVEGGDAVVTTAGNLPANYVIHAAVMGPDHRSSADLVRRAMQAPSAACEELRLHSVAFPAFGTGVGRVEPKDSRRRHGRARCGPTSPRSRSPVSAASISFSSRTTLIRRLGLCSD